MRGTLKVKKEEGGMFSPINFTFNIKHKGNFDIFNHKKLIYDYLGYNN